MSEGQVTLAMLHDLALLYLGLAHGADGNLVPEESYEIAAKLRRWKPDKDPALIDHVIREATLTYLNDGRNRTKEAVSTLRKMLPESLRQEILQDLSDIAHADGTFASGEGEFIASLARAWQLDVEPA